MKKILLAEDDEAIASGLVYALEHEGYRVSRTGSVKESFRLLSENSFDLDLLDMQLPDGIGFDIGLRLKDTDTAVIFLTVVDDEGNIVRAFENGADDYITKPFRLRELLARIKRSLALHEAGSRGRLLQVGELSVDTAAGKVYVGDKVIDLTALEYRLLLTLAVNKGQTLSRGQILGNLWDCAGSFVEDNTLTVYVKRLREKLGDAVHIETVRGIGYRVD